MISLAEARAIIAAQVQPRPAERRRLAQARGCVLAEDAHSDGHHPSGDRSMMDGYVIHEDAVPGRFRVAGEIQAGQAPEQALAEGEAMRIYTGALLPPGGGRVIMQEQARRDGSDVWLEQLPDARFVRARGSEAKPGDVVLPSGARLGPCEMAILAQIGKVEPLVHRPPTVRHVATGNEIVPPEQTPGLGQIRDTNSTLLAALLANLGVEGFDSARSEDDPAVLTSTASTACDLLLISGGASVGDYDFGADALRSLGFTVHFDRVNLRPGKPLTFATRGQQAAFVIPGNPVSHFVCFHVAIRLAVERMAGRSPGWEFLRLPLQGGADLRADPRETFWPANAFIDEGRLAVSPKSWSTSGHTFSLTEVNALIRLQASAPMEDSAETLLLDFP